MHRELSDDELHARLVQRGVDPTRARTYVRNRDDEDASQVLDDLLRDEPS